MTRGAAMDLDFWLAIFGVAATLAGGAWSVIVYLDKRAREDARAAAPRRRDRATSGTPPAQPFPAAAVAVLLLGLVLVGASFFSVGDQITATNSVVTDSVNQSTITIGRDIRNPPTQD